MTVVTLDRFSFWGSSAIFRKAYFTMNEWNDYDTDEAEAHFC